MLNENNLCISSTRQSKATVVKGQLSFCRSCWDLNSEKEASIDYFPR